MDDKALENFIIANSPDGGFLQSEYWRKFQESVGRKAFEFSEKDENDDIIIYSHMLSHELPVVGKYLYLPRGPVVKISNFQFPISNKNFNVKTQNFLDNLIRLAKQNNIGWIRVEPNSEGQLNLIRENLSSKVRIKKETVDVQPREILVMDISKSEEEILAGMKQKTRYNIRLAEKRKVHVTCNTQHVTQEKLNEFLRLVKITSERDKITAHPENYYRKMFETIPGDILKLYVAEYEGKIICANLVLFFGKTATYMHGASDNIHRDAMAPYLLQWQAMLDAKKFGCTKYDLGGINTKYQIPDTKYKNWGGITKFKTGFAPEAKPIEFPGCWDIVLKPGKYRLYRIIQKAKSLLS